METVKEIINHPLSKAVACGVVGLVFIMHKHPLYAGIAFGMGFREFLLAFKKWVRKKKRNLKKLKLGLF